MNQKNVAIIGFGWLGKPLSIALKNNGYTVFAGSRSEYKIKEINDLGLFGFKLTNTSNNVKIDLKSTQLKSIDYLILTVPPSGFENYAHSLANLIMQFSDETKIIFTSSTGIYQDINSKIDESGPIIENHPVFLAEQQLMGISTNRLTIIRLAGLIGYNRHPVKYFVLKNCITKGSSPVNLVRSEDVIRAVLLILEKGFFGEVFNIVSEEHPSRNGYYIQASKYMFKTLLLAENDNPGKTIDGMKFVNRTGFSYKYSIFEWNAFYNTTELT